MGYLSKLIRKKKIAFFLKDIPSDAKVLEIGCSDGWVGEYLRSLGVRHYIGLDLKPPADIVGDIRQWRQLGLKSKSFDYLVAFEVIEHVDCIREAYDLLKPGGLLFLTSPLPHMDWFCRILEIFGFVQKRTSHHHRLIYFKRIPFFEPVDVRIVGFALQWGIFRKNKEDR